ncbi:hypothetical protein DYB35_012741 [Aphanomyces astaci]|uniref:Uncharacterized protein n=1 Tax=Aphanomyces astaci TaxID=112090 RepID=A0A3R6X8U8_APHAT|nr:hypothetical protein DYB35_012741 [Aphanomyces astaci]
MFRLISKIQHDPDTHDCTAATLALADLSSWASSLVAASPVPRLQAVMGNFFPIYLRNLDVKNLNCMHAMDAVQPTSLYIAHAACGRSGQLVSGGSWDATQLHLVYRFLRLREQQAVLSHQSTKHPREVTPPWLLAGSNSAERPIWASKQTYVDGGLLPPKKRTRDLFVDAISSSSSSSAKDDTAAAARGFQAADGRFDADIAPDKLWRLPLFFDSTDVKSTADLIVWHGPVPPILMASCFPPRLLASLNVVRYDLESYV